jgi:peptide/nickel transport system substrate-binding protein
VRFSTRTRAARFVARLVIVVIGLAPAGFVGSVAAQETPRSGGELVFVVPAEPPSFDAHREESFALIHPAAPHYSTLLRVDSDDPSGTKIVGDLAESRPDAATPSHFLNNQLDTVWLAPE